ncbi:MAG: hypothetical protein JXQ23_11815 [Clostridia bacterium]|nr:hypothetical protein [Clostridia bacterium]
MISNFDNSLSKSGSTQLNGFVTTSTTSTVESIEYAMYFQQEVSGNWSTIATRTGIMYNTNLQTAYEYLTVSSGYYYRIRTIHTARNLGDVETRTVLSSAVYV